MKALIVTLALTLSTTAMASYKLSPKDIVVVKKNVELSFGTDASVKYVGKRSVEVVIKGNKCLIKNVTFFKDTSGVKMIDEKTFIKLETCEENA